MKKATMKPCATTRRRTMLKLAGAAALTPLAAPYARAASGSTLKIGFVSPQSGPLAVFAESDAFTIAQVKTALANGLQLAAKPTASKSYTRIPNPTRTAPPTPRPS